MRWFLASLAFSLCVLVYDIMWDLPRAERRRLLRAAGEVILMIGLIAATLYVLWAQ